MLLTLLPQEQPELVYQYVGVLMQHSSRDTMSMLMNMKCVEPLKVLPSLLYVVSHDNQSRVSNDTI